MQTHIKQWWLFVFWCFKKVSTQYCLPSGLKAMMLVLILWFIWLLATQSSSFSHFTIPTFFRLFWNLTFHFSFLTHIQSVKITEIFPKFSKLSKISQIFWKFLFEAIFGFGWKHFRHHICGKLLEFWRRILLFFKSLRCTESSAAAQTFFKPFFVSQADRNWSIITQITATHSRLGIKNLPTNTFLGLRSVKNGSRMQENI